MKKIVSFRRMEDGTREDYLLLDESERDFAAGLPDRVLAALGKLDNSLKAIPSRDSSTRCRWRRVRKLQAPTRNSCSGPCCTISATNSPRTTTPRSRPGSCAYVRPEVTWIVEQHGLFQTYYYVHHLGGDRHQRERLMGHRWYDACVAFCDWDQASFDPDYATRPLAHFEPLLRRILSRPAHDPRYVSAES